MSVGLGLRGVESPSALLHGEEFSLEGGVGLPSGLSQKADLVPLLEFADFEVSLGKLTLADQKVVWLIDISEGKSNKKRPSSVWLQKPLLRASEVHIYVFCWSEIYQRSNDSSTNYLQVNLPHMK
jgi:hypothetical protein